MEVQRERMDMWAQRDKGEAGMHWGRRIDDTHCRVKNS